MYLNHVPSAAIMPYVAADKVVLTSTGVSLVHFAIQHQVEVKRVMFQLSTAVSSSVSAVVAVKYYPVIGSSSNAVTVATLTIPTGTAAGVIIYKDINEYIAVPGGEIVFDVTTAATSTGIGVAGFWCNLDPEYVTNQTNMVASA